MAVSDKQRCSPPSVLLAKINMNSTSSDASGFTFNPGMDALHTPFRKTTSEAAAVGQLDTPGSELVFRRTPEDVNRFEAWRNAIEAVTPSSATPGTPAWLGTPESMAESAASSAHFARWMRTINRCSLTPVSSSQTPASAAALAAGHPHPASPSLLSPADTFSAEAPAAAPDVAQGATRSPLQQLQGPRISSCVKPSTGSSSSTGKGAEHGARVQQGAAAPSNGGGSNENSDPSSLLTPLRGLQLGATPTHTPAAAAPAVTPSAQQWGTPGWRRRVALGGISDAPTPASPMQQAIDLMLAPQQLEEAGSELLGGGTSPTSATPGSHAGRLSSSATEFTAATPGASSSKATPSRAALTPEQKAIRLMLQPCNILTSNAVPAAASQQQPLDGGEESDVASQAASSEVDSAAADGEVSEDDIDAQDLLELCGPNSMGASGVAEVLEFVMCTPGGGKPAGSGMQATPALGGTGTGGAAPFGGVPSGACEEGCGDVEPRVLFADHTDE